MFPMMLERHGDKPWMDHTSMSFGDQGSILVAIKDDDDHPADEVKYSLNHGKDWANVDIKLNGD